MPVFLWEGKNRNNQIQKGELEAANEAAVRLQLNRLRITPTKIKKKPKDLFENVAFLQPKVKEHDIIIFARQFSTMIDAGLPIVQCLDILYSQQENATFKKMLKQIKESVEGGATLADSLKKFPKHFDNLFVNMIAAGEVGGILDHLWHIRDWEGEPRRFRRAAGRCFSETRQIYWKKDPTQQR